MGRFGNQRIKTHLPMALLSLPWMFFFFMSLKRRPNSTILRGTLVWNVIPFMLINALNGYDSALYSYSPTGTIVMTVIFQLVLTGFAIILNQYYFDLKLHHKIKDIR